jgi:sodium-dependent phosphate transporter
MLWNRKAPEDAGSRSAIRDFRIRKSLDHDTLPQTGDAPATAQTAEKAIPRAESSSSSAIENPAQAKAAELLQEPHQPEALPRESALEREVETPQIEGFPLAPRNLWIILRYKVAPLVWKSISHGSSVDIHAMQAQEGTSEAARMAVIHGAAKQYDNDTEYAFTFMQVLTSCTASFAHGANDLSNAIGPFSVIYYTWKFGLPAGKNSDIEVWMLVYGASALVLGLATYGYNIMAVLGNRITLISPSRGFTMELGAAITVILASQYGIPVSTTMCITGATVGVSCCNGDWRGESNITFIKKNASELIDTSFFRLPPGAYSNQLAANRLDLLRLAGDYRRRHDRFSLPARNRYQRTPIVISPSKRNFYFHLDYRRISSPYNALPVACTIV